MLSYGHNSSRVQLQQEGQEIKSGLRHVALGLPLLLRLELFSQDRCDLALHESPGYRRISQRTFLTAWTVYLKKNNLLRIHSDK